MPTLSHKLLEAEMEWLYSQAEASEMIHSDTVLSFSRVFFFFCTRPMNGASETGWAVLLLPYWVLLLYIFVGIIQNTKQIHISLPSFDSFSIVHSAYAGTPTLVSPHTVPSSLCLSFIFLFSLIFSYLKDWLCGFKHEFCYFPCDLGQRCVSISSSVQRDGNSISS